MINIKKSTILASAFSLEGSKHFFGNMMLPEDLLKETEEFIERNALSVTGTVSPGIIPNELNPAGADSDDELIGNSVVQEANGGGEDFEKAPPCCPRCLKAHLVSKLGEESVLGFEAFENEELGHGGYYLDEGNLVKMPIN